MLEIPVLDLLLAGTRPEESARLLAAASRLGCFRVSGHGVPRALQADMRAAARALHELPVDTKAARNAHVAPADGGYVRTSAANPLFESLSVYDASAPADVEAFCDLLDAPPHIRATIMAYAEKMHGVAVDIAAKLASSLGVDEEGGGGGSSFHDWPCQLRMNKYNYTPETVGSPGVQVHTDTSFLTVLLEDDSISGLEVADPDTGEFEPVDPPLPGSLLVNIGDIATAWSNGALHNPKHGVRCVAAAPRFTTGMFLLAPRDGVVRTPEALVDARRPRRFRAFGYDEYRHARHSTHGRPGEALLHFAVGTGTDGIHGASA